MKDFFTEYSILEYSFILIVDYFEDVIPLFCIVTDENFVVFQHLYTFSPLPNSTSEVKSEVAQFCPTL